MRLFFEFFQFPVFIKSHDRAHPASGNNISSITHSNITAAMDNIRYSGRLTSISAETTIREQKKPA